MGRGEDGWGGDGSERDRWVGTGRLWPGRRPRNKNLSPPSPPAHAPPAASRHPRPRPPVRAHRDTRAPSATPPSTPAAERQSAGCGPEARRAEPLGPRPKNARGRTRPGSRAATTPPPASSHARPRTRARSRARARARGSHTVAAAAAPLRPREQMVVIEATRLFFSLFWAPPRSRGPLELSPPSRSPCGGRSDGCRPRASGSRGEGPRGAREVRGGRAPVEVPRGAEPTLEVARPRGRVSSAAARPRPAPGRAPPAAASRPAAPPSRLAPRRPGGETHTGPKPFLERRRRRRDSLLRRRSPRSSSSSSPSASK